MLTVSRIGRNAPAYVSVAAVAISVAACSWLVSGKEMSVAGGRIEADVRQLVLRDAGQPAKSVTCPDLPAKVNASIRCELVNAGDQPYGVTVKTTAVAGEDVKYSINIYDDPAR